MTKSRKRQRTVESLALWHLARMRARLERVEADQATQRAELESLRASLAAVTRPLESLRASLEVISAKVMRASTSDIEANAAALDTVKAVEEQLHALKGRVRALEYLAGVEWEEQ